MDAGYSKVYEELLRGIATLPPDEARVLQLYYIDSCTWREVTRILGMSYEEVRVIYWRAIDKLKPQLTTMTP